MPEPHELERFGWHRLAEHPIFQGTWLMEIPEETPVVEATPLTGELSPAASPPNRPRRLP